MGSSPSKYARQLDKIETDIRNDIEEYKKTSFLYLKSMPKIINKLDISSAMDVEKVAQELRYVDKIHNVLNKESPTDLEEYRKDVAELLLSTGIFRFIVSVVDRYQKTFDQHSEKYTLLSLALDILFNYTDWSELLAAEVSNSRVLDICHDILEASCYKQQKSEVHMISTLSTTAYQRVFSCVNIVHNVSMRDANVNCLRGLGFIKVLAQYMKSDDDMIKMVCLATLANLVVESECDIIGSNHKSVAWLLKVLSLGLGEKNRRFSGWSCKECALAVRKLARNDANKQMLWELGAIQLLVKLTETGDRDEQLEGILAIWALAFDGMIRTHIAENKDLGVVEMLLKLTRSGETNKLGNACQRCLWILRVELNSSPVKEYKVAVRALKWKPESSDVKTVKAGHIMISYQSGHRNIVTEIRDKLKDKSYTVWMDVDDMGGGSTLQAMAEAIENACVVLVCYSLSYKGSQYCQSEAEYAYLLKKPIIPLKMESDYKPDGWLGILLGTRYFVDFSEENSFEDQIEKLYKEIRK